MYIMATESIQAVCCYKSHLPVCVTMCVFPPLLGKGLVNFIPRSAAGKLLDKRFHAAENTPNKEGIVARVSVDLLNIC
jgi:hypothetical protein